MSLKKTDALPLPAEGYAYGEEARMRTFALQLFYLMRVYVAPAAPPAVWSAVEALEAALRTEPYPDTADRKDSVLMNAWEDVIRAQRSVRGWGWRTAHAVKDAVSKAMSAVSNARRADRAAAENDEVYEAEAHEACHRRSDAALEAGQACLIASELGVPSAYFEPFRALLLADDASIVPGYSWWKQQERTVSDSDRLRNFAANTMQAVEPLRTGMSQEAADKIMSALFKDDDALTAALEGAMAHVAESRASTTDDPESDGPLLFQRTTLLAIDAMLDARRADAYRKRAAETDDPNECQWLKKAADSIIVAAHGKALAVCAEAEAAAVGPLELAYMRSRLPVSGP